MVLCPEAEELLCTFAEKLDWKESLHQNAAVLLPPIVALVLFVVWQFTQFAGDRSLVRPSSLRLFVLLLLRRCCCCHCSYG